MEQRVLKVSARKAQSSGGQRDGGSVHSSPDVMLRTEMQPRKSKSQVEHSGFGLIKYVQKCKL